MAGWLRARLRAFLGIQALHDRLVELTTLNILFLEGKRMSKEFDDLVAQVAATESVELSAISLIQGLAQQIADAAEEPSRLADLTARLKASADSLAAAIVANTPAAADPQAGDQPAG